MREFFLNLSDFHIYKWSDYFDIPLTEDNVRLTVGLNVNNSRIVSKIHKTALSLPTTMMTGYIFVQSGTLNIISDSMNKNISLHDGEFVKYLSEHYMLEHSRNSKWLVMWLYEELLEKK